MTALVVESWIWYGFVMAVSLSRFISRRMSLGAFRRYQSDDYVMMGTLCFYTTLIVTINILRHNNSNLLPPGYDIAHLSEQDIRERTYGSKLVLVVEQCQCVTIWAAKACLIIMYLRLTTLRRENLAVKCLAGYTAFTFCFMEVFYLGVWCRPFHDYWAVPTPNVQCDAATNHLITNAVFNISSDCLMLAIALPMFIRLQLPLKKKIPVVGIFSLGIFVILAAILNKVYSFTEPFGSMWTYWYVRECSTALLVANLPFVWTFWRKLSGARTTAAVSGRGVSEGLSREGTVERGRRQGSTRSGGAYPYPSKMGEAGDSLDDLEMGQFSGSRARGSLTLHDILRESNTDLPKDENVSPITHPSLFYARDGGNARPEKAVVRDNHEAGLVRRDPSPESLPGDLAPSQRSAGSFV